MKSLRRGSLAGPCSGNTLLKNQTKIFPNDELLGIFLSPQGGSQGPCTLSPLCLSHVPLEVPQESQAGVSCESLALHKWLRWLRWALTELWHRGCWPLELC